MQLGDGDCFVLEPVDHPLAHHQAGRHDLDRDLAVERDLVGEEHGGHAPAPELAADVELAERGAPKATDDVTQIGRGIRGRDHRAGGHRVLGRYAAVGAGEVSGEEQLAALLAPEGLDPAGGTIAISVVEITTAV